MGVTTKYAGRALAPLLLLAACDTGGTSPPPVARIEIDAPADRLARGDSMRLTATPRDEQGNAFAGMPVEWSSGNPAVATVDASGLVRALEWGQVAIRAAAGGRTDSIILTVPSPVASVYFPDAPLALRSTVPLGGERLLRPVVLDTTGVGNTSIPVAFASSDPSVATVDQAGQVRGLRAGTATISAAAGGQTGRLEVRVAPGYAAAVLARVSEPAGGRLLPLGMNAGGDVVGIFGTSGTLDDRAFVFSGGTLRLLELPSPAAAEAVNADGEVAGWFQPAAGPRHAFLWRDGTVTDLSPDAVHDTQARDINDAGRVVGFWRSGGPPFSGHALLWENGVETDLGTFGWGEAAATAVNGPGDIAGRVQGDSAPRLFLRRAGGQVTFRAVPGGATPAPTAMNDAGVVVGSLSEGTVHGFIWSGDQLTVIPAPHRMGVVPMDVNESGTVVGYHNTDPALGSRWGWVWGGTEPLELTGLVEGWSIVFAGAVDDAGRIAAFGCDAQGCALLLLTPLP